MKIKYFHDKKFGHLMGTMAERETKNHFIYLFESKAAKDKAFNIDKLLRRLEKDMENIHRRWI